MHLSVNLFVTAFKQHSASWDVIGPATEGCEVESPVCI